jgi:hypothetical protein
MTNAHSETGQMAVCRQNMTLCAFSSCSALSVLVGALFKKFGLFLNMPCTSSPFFPFSHHFSTYNTEATRMPLEHSQLTPRLHSLTFQKTGIYVLCISQNMKFQYGAGFLILT